MVELVLIGDGTPILIKVQRNLTMHGRLQERIIQDSSIESLSMDSKKVENYELI